MEELHGDTHEVTQWFWRAVTGLIVLTVFAVFYDVSEELVRTLQVVPGGVDVFSALGGAFIQIAFFGGIGTVLGGFAWGANREYLRLSNGYLEYHWFFWEWDCLRKADLRGFSEARIGTHTIRHRRRNYPAPCILFTKREGANVSPNADGEGEEYIPLPKGVPEESQQLFLQSVNREIKQINGGR